MSCCRRIVQLCRDCLLVVYQFAADAKAAGAGSALSESTTPQGAFTRLVCQQCSSNIAFLGLTNI